MNKQVVLVTGASSGLGAAIALRFGKSGYRVIVNYLKNKAGAAEVASRIKEVNGEALAIQADVRDRARVESMVAHVLDQWAQIDILVNNAATIADAMLPRMDESAWDRVTDTILKGTFNCTGAVAKAMVEQDRRGHIVNIASLVGLSGRAGQANYAAAKAGMIAFTKSIARELGAYGIQVNAILPGVMQTPMLAPLPPKAQDRLQRETILKTFSPLDEIAYFIFNLMAISSVSGQVFNLDSRIVGCS